jgi:hypothetical protein
VGCHETAVGCGCFLWLRPFSASVLVWGKSFSPRVVHGSLLKLPRCVCESMQRLLRNPHEQTLEHDASGH